MERSRQIEEHFERRTAELTKSRENPTVEGEDGDREGFCVLIYRQIKQDKDLAVIANTANASFYNIRKQCSGSVYTLDARELSD